MIAPNSRRTRLDLPPDPRFAAQAYLVGCGSGGPVAYWGIQARDGVEEEVELVERHVRRLCGRMPHVLAAFAVADWDAAFSPWPAEGAAGRRFAGRARDTLTWLEGVCVPAVEEAIGHAPRPGGPSGRQDGTGRFLVGYSLAGLFALWALGEGTAFEGAASCSGSLWFPGWAGHAQAARYPTGSLVYLSLGLREERAHDPLMASVGDATRAQADLLAADPAVRSSTLEWNGGGHFTETSLRVAKGMAWLLSAGGYSPSSGSIRASSDNAGAMPATAPNSPREVCDHPRLS